MAEIEKKGLELDGALDGSGMRVGIVHTRWNADVVNSLVSGAEEQLVRVPCCLMLCSEPRCASRPALHPPHSHAGVSGLVLLPHLGQAKYNVAEVIKKDVPGSYELPFAAKWMIETYKVDAVIAIGTLIKGSTMHFEYICQATSDGIMKVGLDTGVPVVFGVLTCLTIEQSLERAGLTEGGHNHGSDWGATAVEMALLKRPACEVKRFKPTAGA